VRRSGPTGGYTVVELVLVVALIGLLSAVGAPRFFARRDLDERLAASEVTAALRQARRVAVTTGCPVETRFDGGSVRLAQRAACTSGAFSAPVPDPAGNAGGYARTLPASLALASNVDPLHFDALGRATDDAGTVRDASVSVGARIVSVVGSTGLVRTQ
jgi:MSHA pilin protein MshC